MFLVAKAVRVRTANNGACEKHRRCCGCSLSVYGVALSFSLQVQAVLQKDRTIPALEGKSQRWPRWCHWQHPSDPHQQPLGRHRCEALESGGLAPGGVVTKGSAGSTAISLATVAPAYGCKCHVVIPDDAAIEKSQILEALGATVERVRPVSITHGEHFVNIARRRATEANELALKHKKGEPMDGQALEQVNGFQCDEEKQSAVSSYAGGYFADQFENLANFRAHYEGTGPEIWEQTGGNVDAFVAAAGTGGTLAGVSGFLQEKKSNVKCYLIDPPGSGFINKVTRGVTYTREEAEGRRLKNPFDTITEGIGINRITKKFMMAKLDGAFRGTDREAVEMSRFLMKNNGLFLGSSSAMNCVGAVRAAQSLGPGHTIVTILCDSGMRHLSKFCSAEYLSQYGLTPSASGLEFLGVA
ncbi:cysteine synthase 2-like isoform X2 [Malus sylvestris]|uniref:cysteine synthase 2-like isoform X2 n=1 Tax=Malus sylvestris TaxID=3752 RepID=UPI0021AC1CD2|nr:cysteine synthase 2-like isoform X2 [Malus sylvestris]